MNDSNPMPEHRSAKDDKIEHLQEELEDVRADAALLREENERLQEACKERDAEIKRLEKENIDRLMQKVKLEEEIQRLRSSPTVTETDELIARLRLGGPNALEVTDEAAEALHRLARNQMSTDYANLARVTALQTQEADAATRHANEQHQRADALDHKCTQFTEALLKGMTLVDELLRENGRLCAASNEPPSVRLFAAKASWDTAMHKLLGDTHPT